MTVDKVSVTITLGVAVIVVVLGLDVMAAYSETREPFVEQSESWCDARNGELINVQSVVHGGLHCELPNGSLVQMGDVVAAREDEQS